MAPQDQTTQGKSVAEPSFEVHRRSEAGSFSMEPYGEDGEGSNTPPPYSGPTTSSKNTPQPSQAQLVFPGLLPLDYRLYSPQSFYLSSDLTTITSYDPRFSASPAALVSLIQSLTTVPPKPIVRIRGKNSATDEVDFDVKLNMMNLIVPETEKGRMNYMKLIGPGELGFRGNFKETTAPTVSRGLEEWASIFCSDPSSFKEFVLYRVVTNWDTSYLEGRLLSLMNNMSYPGRVTVTFPLTHSRVVVRNPDKVNRFFSNVTKVFTGTKKFEVIKSVWPYADIERGGQGRRVAVQEEEAWFANWKDSIRHAVTVKRQGWVTVEDRLEFIMERKVEDTSLKLPPRGNY